MKNNSIASRLYFGQRGTSGLFR